MLSCGNVKYWNGILAASSLKICALTSKNPYLLNPKRGQHVEVYHAINAIQLWNLAPLGLHLNHRCDCRGKYSRLGNCFQGWTGNA